MCDVKKDACADAKLKISLTWPKVGSYFLYIRVMFANFIAVQVMNCQDFKNSIFV